LEENPELFDDRAVTEIPFLPAQMPARALRPDDLEWRPVVHLPETSQAFHPSTEDVERLLKLQRSPGAVFEYASTLMPGASFIEQGRPCFGRLSLLVETGGGMIVGTEFGSGAVAAGEAAGRDLVKGLLKAGVLPEKLMIGGSQLQPVLAPLCEALHIKLRAASRLPALDQAMEALTQRFAGGMF